MPSGMVKAGALEETREPLAAQVVTLNPPIQLRGVVSTAKRTSHGEGRWRENPVQRDHPGRE
jgi:hypothetical protein